jgi:hypothetical protein
MTEGLRVRRRQYVNVPAATVNDPRLSFKALGLLVWALNKPPGWDLRSAAIAAERSQDGKSAVQSAFRELGTLGYYRIERRRLRNGRFSMGTAISEEPVPEWAQQYAEYGGPVPVIQQPHGSFLVQRKDGSLEPDGFEGLDPAGEPPLRGGNPAPSQGGDVSAGQTGNRFSGSGEAGSGESGAGKPGAITNTEKPVGGDNPPVVPPATGRAASHVAEAPGGTAAALTVPAPGPGEEPQAPGGRDPGDAAADALAREVLAVRGEWARLDVVRALAHPVTRSHPPELVREVLLALANDPDTIAPGRLPAVLPHWHRGSGKPARPARKPSRSASGPLPDGWKPTDALLRWAAATHPGVDAHHETARFVLHHQAHASRRANWAAEWQKWIAGAAGFAAQRAPRAWPATTRPSAADRRMAEIDDLERRMFGTGPASDDEAVPAGTVITIPPDWVTDGP